MSIFVGEDDGDMDGGILTFSNTTGQLNLSNSSVLTFYTNSNLVSPNNSNSNQLQFGSGGSKSVFKGSELDFNGPGTFGPGGPVSTPLPIEIGSFDVSSMKSQTFLNWTTLTELNNDHFTIERSIDLEFWEAIGNLNGMGNSSIEQNYQFVDFGFNNNVINYYRIKQTDFDGQFSYSDIRSVNIEKKEHVLFPNPCVSHFIIQGEAIDAESLIVSDAHGNIVTDKIEILTLGETQISVDSSELPTGLYFVFVSNKAYAMVKE